MITNIEKLRNVMSALRDPDTGCPWDLEQDFKTLTRYTIEEAYEVADAAHNGDMDHLKEELGDLLLQVVFYAQMAQEQNLFTFDDIADGIANKLMSRHPHVFGDQDAQTAADVNVIWDAQKDKEKKNVQSDSVLDDVPVTLPPLQRAEKLMKRAGKIGFKFDNADQARAKFEGELIEFKDTPNRDEYGDVLFSFIAWARMEMKDRNDETSSDEALDHANRKFIDRFKETERLAKLSPPSSLEDWSALWERGKKLCDKKIRLSGS